MNVTVRKATKDDMLQVQKLIKELAEFENLGEDEMSIDASVLVKDGFERENPAFSCFVAEISDGPVVGYALYYTAYSTFLGRTTFLEDLYVQPAYRKSGTGKELFLAVAKVAHEMESKRMDFHVLSWNPAVEFYKRLGAIDLSESEKWQLFRLDEQALNNIFSSQPS